MVSPGGVHNGEQSGPVHPEFKRQMVDLMGSGRTPRVLAKEFGPDVGLNKTREQGLLELRRENRRQAAQILSGARGPGWSGLTFQGKSASSCSTVVALAARYTDASGRHAARCR
jgi:hypothetical protein